jgi:ATP-dependent protease ClpP protease subunit
MNHEEIVRLTEAQMGVSRDAFARLSGQSGLVAPSAPQKLPVRFVQGRVDSRPPPVTPRSERNRAYDLLCTWAAWRTTFLEPGSFVAGDVLAHADASPATHSLLQLAASNPRWGMSWREANAYDQLCPPEDCAEPRYGLQIRGNTATMTLRDSIGEDFGGVPVATILNDIERVRRVGADLHLDIFSAGGCAQGAIDIASAIASLGVYVTATIDMLAASAASIICCAAREIVFQSPQAMWMMHCCVRPQNADDAMAAHCDQIDKTMCQMYSDRSGLSYNDVADLLGAESWLCAADAQRLGFA